MLFSWDGIRKVSSKVELVRSGRQCATMLKWLTSRAPAKGATAISNCTSRASLPARSGSGFGPQHQRRAGQPSIEKTTRSPDRPRLASFEPKLVAHGAGRIHAIEGGADRLQLHQHGAPHGERHEQSRRVEEQHQQHHEALAVPSWFAFAPGVVDQAPACRCAAAHRRRRRCTRRNARTRSERAICGYRCPCGRRARISCTRCTRAPRRDR